MNRMSNAPTLRPTARRAPALLVLVLGLAATAFGVWREIELQRRNQQLRFQENLAPVSNGLREFFLQRFEVLHDQTRSALRRGNFSTEAWDDFAQHSEWRQHFPGIREIGYAELAGEKCVVKFVTTDGAPAVHAAGSDLNRDPLVRTAVEKSADAGYGIPSRPVPFSGSSNLVVIGFFTVQHRNMSPGTAAENRANLRGLVFYALDQVAYFNAIAKEINSGPFTIRLLRPDEPTVPKTAFQRTITHAGMTGEWRLAITMPPSATSPAPWIVGGAGLLLSVVLSWLVGAQARLRFAAEQAREKLLAHEAAITALNRDLESKVSERTSELSRAISEIQRFRAVLESTSDLAAMADLNGRVLYVNPAGRRLMEFPDGVQPAELEMAGFYPEDVNRFFAEVALPQAMRDGIWSGETRILTWNKREIPVSFVGVVIKDADGKPLHLGCIARDIREQKRIADELQSALITERELSQLKSNFISMVSHEIRTPLALILSSSEILSRYLDRLPAEKRQQHLEQINDAVQRMSSLMEDVLLFSRAEAGRIEFNPQPLDLAALTRQLVDELLSATRHRCPITVELAGDLAAARGDEALLRHVIGNLLNNAVKYSAAGTPVTLRLKRDAGAAVFEIRDTGIGIPEADRAKLFEAFHRGANAKHIPGTGLGLVIVRRCVERHGGEFDLQSREGAGTTATVRLPMFSPAHTEFVKKFF